MLRSTARRLGLLLALAVAFYVVGVLVTLLVCGLAWLIVNVARLRQLHQDRGVQVGPPVHPLGVRHPDDRPTEPR